MINKNQNQNAQTSILDRLVDMDPGVSRESVQYRLATLRQIMPNVIRDLENLLNTRNSPVPLHPGHKYLPGSLIHYGLDDFSNENPASTTALKRLCTEIEKKIKTFEPRLKKVAVQVEAKGKRHARVVFRISGLLVIEPISEPVTFDTYFDSNRGQFFIQG